MAKNLKEAIRNLWVLSTKLEKDICHHKKQSCGILVNLQYTKLSTYF